MPPILLEAQRQGLVGQGWVWIMSETALAAADETEFWAGRSQTEIEVMMKGLLVVSPWNGKGTPRAVKLSAAFAEQPSTATYSLTTQQTISCSTNADVSSGGCE